jgi:hypothetical protein
MNGRIGFPGDRNQAPAMNFSSPVTDWQADCAYAIASNLVEDNNWPKVNRRPADYQRKMIRVRKLSAVLRSKRRRDALSGSVLSHTWRAMRSRPRLIAICLVAAALGASATRASANCDDDCKSEYVSSLDECRSQYEGGDKNQQDLEDCLVDTRSEYEDCLDDCNSLGAGGVMACQSAQGRLLPVIFNAPAP